MKTVSEVINHINDRILELQAKANCLCGLRSEILASAAMLSTSGQNVEGESQPPKTPVDDYIAKSKEPVAQPKARPEAKSKLTKAENVLRFSRAGSPTRKLAVFFTSQLPGVPLKIADVFAASGIDTDSHKSEYLTACSTIGRWVKSGILNRSGYGTVTLVKPLKKPAPEPATHEQKYAEFRAGIPAASAI